jgi:hypothetical protein
VSLWLSRKFPLRRGWGCTAVPPRCDADFSWRRDRVWLAAAHGRALQGDAVRGLQQTVQDGLGQSGVGHGRVPLFSGSWLAKIVERIPVRSSTASKRSRQASTASGLKCAQKGREGHSGTRAGRRGLTVAIRPSGRSSQARTATLGCNPVCGLGAGVPGRRRWSRSRGGRCSRRASLGLFVAPGHRLTFPRPAKS